MNNNELVLTNKGFAHGNSDGETYFSWHINKNQVYQILSKRQLRGFLTAHPEIMELGYDLVELDHYWYSEIATE